MLTGFADWPDSLVASITAPALVVAADRDVVRTEHAVRLASLIPDARLLIVPGNHGDYLGELLAAAGDPGPLRRALPFLVDFLDQPETTTPSRARSKPAAPPPARVFLPNTPVLDGHCCNVRGGFLFQNDMWNCPQATCGKQRDIRPDGHPGLHQLADQSRPRPGQRDADPGGFRLGDRQYPLVFRRFQARNYWLHTRTR
jgi:hypothetical protein